MSDNILNSYLISLKFNVDQGTLTKFNDSLQAAAKSLRRTVGDSNTGLLGDFAKMQAGLVGAVAALGAAFTATGLKFADWDQQMRLGALHSFMTKDAYLELNRALTVLNTNLTDATYDPETHERVLQIIRDTHVMLAGMGPDAEKSARSIRDLKFEWQRFGNELFFLSNSVVNDLFKQLGFGSGTLLDQMQKLNGYLIENLPAISDRIARDVIPILKDTWQTLEDIGDVAKDAFAIFQEAVGVISGDDKLKTANVTFESFAHTLETVVHWADELVKAFDHVEQAILHLDFSKLTGKDAKFLGGAALLSKTGRGLAWNGVKSLLGSGAEATAAEAATGAGVAGGLGLLAIPGAAWLGASKLNQWTKGTWWDTDQQGTQGLKDQMTTLQPAWANAHDRLKDAADKLSALTGQRADLIFGQLMHETGGGTNRGFRDLHNLSGIENSDGSYRNFASDGDYITAMARILNRDFKGTFAHTGDEYAQMLKSARYYAAPEAEYRAGIDRFSGQYASPVQVTNQVTVHLNGSNLSAQDVATHVDAALDRRANLDATYYRIQGAGR